MYKIRVSYSSEALHTKGTGYLLLRDLRYLGYGEEATILALHQHLTICHPTVDDVAALRHQKPFVELLAQSPEHTTGVVHVEYVAVRPHLLDLRE